MSSMAFSVSSISRPLLLFEDQALFALLLLLLVWLLPLLLPFRWVLVTMMLLAVPLVNEPFCVAQSFSLNVWYFFGANGMLTIILLVCVSSFSLLSTLLSFIFWWQNSEIAEIVPNFSKHRAHKQPVMDALTLCFSSSKIIVVRVVSDVLLTRDSFSSLYFALTTSGAFIFD